MMKRYYITFAVLAVICAFAIGTNMLLRQGPVHDQTAVNDIHTLQTAVDNYYLSQNRLPTNLGQISQLSPSVAKRLGDYEYQVTGLLSYELCTTFLTKHQVGSAYPVTSVGDGNPDIHAKGHQCFSYSEIRFQSTPIKPLGQ